MFIRFKETQTWTKCSKQETVELLALNRLSIPQPLPTGFREYHRRMSRKNSTARDLAHWQPNTFYFHNRHGPQMNSVTIASCRILASDQARNNTTTNGTEAHKILPIAQEMFPTDCFWERKSQSSSKAYHFSNR